MAVASQRLMGRQNPYIQARTPCCRGLDLNFNQGMSVNVCEGCLTVFTNPVTILGILHLPFNPIKVSSSHLALMYVIDSLIMNAVCLSFLFGKRD